MKKDKKAARLADQSDETNKDIFMQVILMIIFIGFLFWLVPAWYRE